MSNYTVTFLINYFDHEPEKNWLVTEDFDAENLDSLFDLLDEGIQNEEITPEKIIPDDHRLGNVNIEYVSIRDADRKEVYRGEHDLANMDAVWWDKTVK